MLPKINLKAKANEKISTVFIFDGINDLKGHTDRDMFTYLSDFFTDKENNFLIINQLGILYGFVKFTKKTEQYLTDDALRLAGYRINKSVKEQKIKSLQIIQLCKQKDAALLLTEGLALSAYQFSKYKSDAKKQDLEISIISKDVAQKSVVELQNILESHKIARDFVNEPQSYLNAVQYTKDLKKLCEGTGVKFTFFDKKKIEQLGMGGLLAVNKGSVVPPTFNILEYKPQNPKNKKPIILIGKGVVYDTGGLSLKPTPQSMDYMKCDMAGSAAVVGAIMAISKNKLPVHVISIIAATDNRPGGDAYTPGDVIKMYNGKTVEVLNTDAEGRLTLGDALSYADKYNPEIIIDLATLTGAAARAIGKEASVMMGTASEKYKNALKQTGFQTYERLVEFPLWDEYGEQIKSDIADMTNLGGAEAGATTAGKFLEHFTKSPWIHIDIAGTAYLLAEDKYRGKNATGVGVRLLYHFVKNIYNAK